MFETFLKFKNYKINFINIYKNNLKKRKIQINENKVKFNQIFMIISYITYIFQYIISYALFYIFLLINIITDMIIKMLKNIKEEAPKHHNKYKIKN